MEYTRIDAEELSKKTRGGLIYKLGMGKMQVAALAASKVKGRMLVICPCSLVTCWELEFKNAGVKNYTVVNYEKIKHLKNESFDLLIISEAQLVGRIYTQRTRFVWEGVARRCKRIWCLFNSEAIAANPIKLYPALKCLHSEDLHYSTYESFAKHYCGGAYIYGNYMTLQGPTCVKELKKLLEKHYISR